MELHAFTKTISDIFSVKQKYVVPRFQREYSWDKERIGELWDDIVSNIKKEEDGNFKNEEYFIGSLVLVGDDNSTSMQIVDGQQRLTTLTILLAALAERFKTIGKDQLANSVYDNYVAGTDDDGNRYFKLENETPKPFFQIRIQHIEKDLLAEPTSEEERTLLACYEDFYSRTSSEQLGATFEFSEVNVFLHEKILKAIRDQIVRYLKVISITVREEEEAYTIFETLNARGMDLSFVDLIKNKIFKDLTTSHPDDFAKTQWKQLRETISARNGIGQLETFVRHWWISRYSYSSAQKVYNSFKKKWNSGQIDAETFLRELVADAELYSKISVPSPEDFPQQEHKGILRSLSALKTFNVSQQKPFVLSMFKAFDKQFLTLQDVTATMAFIEKFHFIFNGVCSTRPSGIEGSYSKAARQLFESKNKIEARKVISELKAQLKTRLPEEKIFVEKFISLRFYKGYLKDKKLIQYIFAGLETAKQGTSEFRPDNITIEHILSQSRGRGEITGQIGNLTPLGAELNRAAENKEPKQKFPEYQQSNYKLTNEITESLLENWGEALMRARAIDLASISYNEVWSLENA